MNKKVLPSKIYHYGANHAIPSRMRAKSEILVVGSAVAIIVVLVWGLGSALGPLLFAFALAYLCFPMVKWFEKRGVARYFAVGGALVLITGILTLLIILLAPIFVSESREFLKELPESFATATGRVEVILERWGYPVDLSRENIKLFLSEHSDAVSGDMVKSVSIFIKGIFSNLVRTILVILNLFLIPVFFFHLVNRYEDISRQAQDLIPVPWRNKVKEYTKLSNQVLSGYLRGQMLVSLLLAVLYSSGFLIIGLKFGILIGVFTGLFSMIPFVGGILGFVVAMIVALANYTGIQPILSIIIVFVIVQGLEGLLITPKLVGNKVGLGILPTMLALIVGGNLFGFVGMVVAIPVAAILKAILKELRHQYHGMKFYKGDPNV